MNPNQPTPASANGAPAGRPASFVFAETGIYMIMLMISFFAAMVILGTGDELKGMMESISAMFDPKTGKDAKMQIPGAALAQTFGLAFVIALIGPAVRALFSVLFRRGG